MKTPLEFKFFLPLAKSIGDSTNLITNKPLSKELAKSIFSVQTSTQSTYEPETLSADTKGNQVPLYSNIYIEGIASGTALDLADERMAESALASMVESFKSQGGIPLREVHDREYTGILGLVTDLYLTRDENNISSVAYKAVLENPEANPKVQTLLNSLNKGTILAVSIGARIDDWDWVETTYIAEYGQSCQSWDFVIKECTLSELSVTQFPAYTLATLDIVKSLAKAKESMPISPLSKSEMPEETPVTVPEEPTTTPVVEEEISKSESQDETPPALATAEPTPQVVGEDNGDNQENAAPTEPTTPTEVEPVPATDEESVPLPEVQAEPEAKKGYTDEEVEALVKAKTAPLMETLTKMQEKLNEISVQMTKNAPQNRGEFRAVATDPVNVLDAHPVAKSFSYKDKQFTDTASVLSYAKKLASPEEGAALYQAAVQALSR